MAIQMADTHWFDGNDGRRYLTVQEFARVAQLSTSTVYNRIRSRGEAGIAWVAPTEVGISGSHHGSGGRPLAKLIPESELQRFGAVKPNEQQASSPAGTEMAEDRYRARASPEKDRAGTPGTHDYARRLDAAEGEVVRLKAELAKANHKFRLELEKSMSLLDELRRREELTRQQLEQDLAPSSPDEI